MLTSIDFLHIVFFIDFRIDGLWMQKNDATKLACALQTILSVLICACVIIVEIVKRFWILYREGEIELESDDADDEEEWTAV